MYGIHWFRRDLRVQGNPALDRARERFNGRVVGVFFIDQTFLSRPDFSANRFGFFLNTLRALRDELREAGSDLLVLDAPPIEGFPKLLAALKKSGQSRGLPAAVSYNRDYEPFARARDSAITALLERKHGIEVLTERDHLIIEPTELAKPGADGGHYQVFTPFARRWRGMLLEDRSLLARRVEAQLPALQALKRREAGRAPEKDFVLRLRWKNLFPGPAPFEDCLEAVIEKNSASVTVPLPEAGTLAAYRRLASFGERLARYGEDRDFPALPDATSGLSVYLKNGSITTAQIIAGLKLTGHLKDTTSGAGKFLQELIWREFYYHILFHHPSVEKQSFQAKFRGVKWENQRDQFEAWKAGRTGYPIVDAGMRQLAETGLMHNRVRMIVASFLTKHLLIDWRWGERYFMRTLLDGDMAANNGGWQWAASTGCDPQPYFRIFHPVLQGKKFDPEAEYIRKYVPELRSLSKKDIHRLPDESLRPAEYAPPLVDHAQARVRAISRFRSA